MDGYHFSVDVRVRFSETDAQGIANNAVYLNWFEVARVTYLARFPGGYRGLIESGVEALTIEAYVRYGTKAVPVEEPTTTGPTHTGATTGTTTSNGTTTR